MKIKGLTPFLFILLIILFVTGHADFLEGPLTSFMHMSEDWIGGTNAVGWSIVILTFVVRLILLPMMIPTTWRNHSTRKDAFVATTDEQDSRSAEDSTNTRRKDVGFSSYDGCLP